MNIHNDITNKMSPIQKHEFLIFIINIQILILKNPWTWEQKWNIL